MSDVGRVVPSTATEQAILLRLQRKALEYFVDNQLANGLVLDRQRNHGPLVSTGLCSVAATGMGCIALALASASPYRLLTPDEARRRILAVIGHALEGLPHDHGILPHFVDAVSGAVVGWDAFSTVDSAWLYAGTLWASEFLQDRELQDLAWQLYRRVNWRHYAAPSEVGLLHHGKDAQRRFLPCTWDRLNGETIFMYVLAAGAEVGRAVSPCVRNAWQFFPGTVAGHHFHSADLGLFVFQYGFDLIDVLDWQGPIDLHTDARSATLANRDFCRRMADRFTTYRHFWGLSAGDGPGEDMKEHAYRAFAPGSLCDGTAHLTSTLASLTHAPAAVLENVWQAEHKATLGVEGRYGLSSVNLDRGWVARDMVGIDAGAAVLAIDNAFMEGRVRCIFHRLNCVKRGLRQLGFLPRTALAADSRQAS